MKLWLGSRSLFQARRARELRAKKSKSKPKTKTVSGKKTTIWDDSIAASSAPTTTPPQYAPPTHKTNEDENASVPLPTAMSATTVEFSSNGEFTTFYIVIATMASAFIIIVAAVVLCRKQKIEDQDISHAHAGRHDSHVHAQDVLEVNNDALSVLHTTTRRPSSAFSEDNEYLFSLRRLPI